MAVDDDPYHSAIMPKGVSRDDPQLSGEATEEEEEVGSAIFRAALAGDGPEDKHEGAQVETTETGPLDTIAEKEVPAETLEKEAAATFERAPTGEGTDTPSGIYASLFW